MSKALHGSMVLSLLQHFRKLDWDKVLPGVTQPEYLILSAISYGQEAHPEGLGIYVSALADSLMTSVSMVSKLLKTMEEKDWILRTVDKQSRRNTYVTLTKEGQKILSAADQRMDQLNQAVAKELGEEVHKQLISNITALMTSYEKVLSQL